MIEFTDATKETLRALKKAQNEIAWKLEELEPSPTGDPADDEILKTWAATSSAVESADDLFDEMLIAAGA